MFGSIGLFEPKCCLLSDQKIYLLFTDRHYVIHKLLDSEFCSIFKRALLIKALLTLIAKQIQAVLNVSYVYTHEVWIIICIIFVFATLIEYAIAISWLFDEKTVAQENAIFMNNIWNKKWVSFINQEIVCGYGFKSFVFVAFCDYFKYLHTCCLLIMLIFFNYMLILFIKL